MPSIMALWSEIFGLVQDVRIFEEHAIALIGKIHVVFPIEVGQKLRTHVGVRVAILHTDIEGKGYLIRTLSQKSISEMTCFYCGRRIRANDPVVETSEGPVHADCYDDMETSIYDEEVA